MQLIVSNINNYNNTDNNKTYIYYSVMNNASRWLFAEDTQWYPMIPNDTQWRHVVVTQFRILY